ncbi:winged helix-turn-helix domain-containing protein [Sphingobium yanoikuyae]|uniref:winged helix-turn-helix domain-containing protein n=1 Tax=Sphingobium yanoikuyae TaxID=13690 RepID=UPI00345E1814
MRPAATRKSYDRAIDVQVSRLRRKLERGEMGDELVRTIRNEGYMFTPRSARREPGKAAGCRRAGALQSLDPDPDRLSGRRHPACWRWAR